MGSPHPASRRELEPSGPETLEFASARGKKSGLDLAAVPAPQGVETLVAVLVDAAVGVRTEEIAQPLGQGRGQPLGAQGDRQRGEDDGQVGFDRIIEWWLPLTWALNQINRSMGHQDLYPFVLPPKVLEKMEFIHELITSDD